jgi:Crp-like helix-turn-helix domain
LYIIDKPNYFNPVKMTSSLFSQRKFSILTWENVLKWADENHHSQIFNKDESIPTKSGLIYIVVNGIVGIKGKSKLNPISKKFSDEMEKESETFLGFIGARNCFEMIDDPSITVEFYAHTEETNILWIEWEELNNWDDLRLEVMENFKYQYQRQILLLHINAQKSTIERLLNFLIFLGEEYGEKIETGYLLPFYLTHAQIGAGIGATRVTVTRLMGKLKKLGLIFQTKNTFIIVNKKAIYN